MKELINYFLPSDNDTPMVLEICGISYCDASYLINRPKSMICVMEYIVSGTGVVILDGREYSASKGDIYILPEGRDQKYYSDTQDPWEKIFINMRGRLIVDLLSAYELDNCFVFPGSNNLEPLFRDLFELSGSQLPELRKVQQCSLKIHEIIASLHSQHNKNPAISEDALNVKSMIERKLDYNYKIAELAASIYRSEDYVIKLFRRSFGETPYAYALNLKTRTAARLLTETHLAINEIAAMVGFEDARYFSHVFRRKYGVPPSVYRKNKNIVT